MPLREVALERHGLRFAGRRIDWPVSEPLLSDKDAKAPVLADVPEDRLPVFVQ